MTPEELRSQAAVARQKLQGWRLGKRAKNVGLLIIEFSLAQGRAGVRMYNREIELLLGIDKGDVTDGIGELVTNGVLQVIGRSGSCRVFRWLTNAEMVEPETQVDPHLAAITRAEVLRRNEQGTDIEADGQRTLAVATAEEKLAEDLAAGSQLRAQEDEKFHRRAAKAALANIGSTADFDIRRKVVESLRSAGWTEEEIEGTNGARQSCPQPEINSEMPAAAGLGAEPRGGGGLAESQARGGLGTQPSEGVRMAECQAPGPADTPPARTPAHTRARPLVPLVNGPTGPQWNHCGAAAPETNGESQSRTAEERKRIACSDKYLLQLVEEQVGAHNRGYWAVVLGKDGVKGANALFEALGEYKLGGGVPPNVDVDPSRYLFGIYKRWRGS